MSQIEKGLKGFTSDSITALAHTLGCEPSDLLVGYTEPVEPTPQRTHSAASELAVIANTLREQDEIIERQRLALDAFGHIPKNVREALAAFHGPWEPFELFLGIAPEQLARQSDKRRTRT